MARSQKYPFDQLDVGQGFVIPPGTVTPISLSSYVSKRGRILGKRFGCRWDRDGSATVYRKPDAASEDTGKFTIIDGAGNPPDTPLRRRVRAVDGR